MKTDLIDFWQNAVPINYKQRVDRIKDTACAITIEVMDFDRVKDEFSNIIDIPENRKLSSVDGIKLDKNKNVCLLEMKGFDWDKCESQHDKIEMVKKKINDAIPKFVDSSYILISMLGHYNVKKSWYHIILHPKKLQIIPYLIINCNYQDFLNLKTATEPYLHIKVSSRIKHPIRLINCDEFERLFS